MIESVAEPTIPDLRHRLWVAETLAALPGVRHGATGRLPGLPGEGNVGFGPPRDRSLASLWRRRWADAIGVDHDRLTAARQVHGVAVLRVEAAGAGRGATPGSEPIGTADALMTDVPGVPLLSLHADCQPIFFADPVRRVVAVAHAGWRGAVADVAGRTVLALGDAYGSDPADLVVALGPAIGGELYEVGPEVIAAWRANAGADADRAMVVGYDRARFDLSAANRLLLSRAGVRPTQIESSPVCTLRDGDRWFSHRGQGPATGRFGAIIALAGSSS